MTGHHDTAEGAIKCELRRMRHSIAIKLITRRPLTVNVALKIADELIAKSGIKDVLEEHGAEREADIKAQQAAMDNLRRMAESEGPNVGMIPGGGRGNA